MLDEKIQFDVPGTDSRWGIGGEVYPVFVQWGDGNYGETEYNRVPYADRNRQPILRGHIVSTNFGNSPRSYYARGEYEIESVEEWTSNSKIGMYVNGVWEEVHKASKWKKITAKLTDSG